LLRAAPHLRLVAVSSSGKVADVPMLKRAGFRGFVKRDASLAEFAAVAVAVASGQLAFPVARASVRAGTRTPDEQALLLARHLTGREHQILVMLVAGASSTEIGEQLDIRGTTVRTHIQNIMVKLQVHTRLQAVMFAVRHGLVSVGDDGSEEGSVEEGGDTA
jgi:DNA-binding NarL/FixJ family response regulator